MERQELLIAIGIRIRMIRLTKNLTQSQLATICNFEKSTVSKIEAGLVNISYLTLFRLSTGLDVSMCKLVTPDGPEGMGSLGNLDNLAKQDGDNEDGKSRKSN